MHQCLEAICFQKPSHDQQTDLKKKTIFNYRSQWRVAFPCEIEQANNRINIQKITYQKKGGGG